MPFKVNNWYETLFPNPKHYYQCEDWSFGYVEVERDFLVLLGFFFSDFGNGCQHIDDDFQ